jgi:hypothetical protein
MTIAGHRQAAPTRDAEQITVFERIDGRLREIAASLGAAERQYPALIARPVLDRAGYPRAFPHLLMCAGRSAPREGTPGLTAPEDGVVTGCDDVVGGDAWCLSPAVCYHAFADLAGRVIEDAVVLTARGRCFRAERDTAPGTRQIEFEMREIVLVGPIDWIDASTEAARLAIQATAAEMGLSGDWQAAEDPFFLPAAAGRAMMQRLLKVKLEYQSPRAGGLALASINRHGLFFGQRFGILTGEGDPVHTACVAIGLDRWSHRCHEDALSRHCPDKVSRS